MDESDDPRRGAFPTKRAIHPAQGREALSRLFLIQPFRLNPVLVSALEFPDPRVPGDSYCCTNRYRCFGRYLGPPTMMVWDEVTEHIYYLVPGNWYI